MLKVNNIIEIFRRTTIICSSTCCKAEYVEKLPCGYNMPQRTYRTAQHVEQSQEYQTGVKTDKKHMDEKRIAHHSVIPELNYRIFS